ncbi:MAG TPA: peptidase S8, partial [Pseudonocardiaceae bacterium]|nr:peptidase S8 [Pseudonocardiaceae bacterium]
MGAPVAVFIELVQTPAVDVFHTERRAGRSAAAAARAASATKSEAVQAANRVLEMLRRRGASVGELFRTTNAVPGLAVIADPIGVRELRAWQQTGWLGDGIRIGIIDDGIDYTHADFGGPGTRAAYTAIHRTVVKPSYFPTRKVVG